MSLVIDDGADAELVVMAVEEREELLLLLLREEVSGQEWGYLRSIGSMGEELSVLALLEPEKRVVLELVGWWRGIWLVDMLGITLLTRCLERAIRSMRCRDGPSWWYRL